MHRLWEYSDNEIEHIMSIKNRMGNRTNEKFIFVETFILFMENAH